MVIMEESKVVIEAVVNIHFMILIIALIVMAVMVSLLLFNSRS